MIWLMDSTSMMLSNHVTKTATSLAIHSKNSEDKLSESEESLKTNLPLLLPVSILTVSISCFRTEIIARLWEFPKMSSIIQCAMVMMISITTEVKMAPIGSMKNCFL